MLSRREQEVVRLAARGRTNKEIAAELVLSERTVVRLDPFPSDVAGAFEATMIKAIAASTVVITPAKLSEPDLREAGKILAEVNAFNQRFNADIQHRVLINEAESLNPMYQRHALAEVDASALVRFEHLMNRRAPYREIFITGYPPHFAGKGRATVEKAVTELNDIVAEIDAILTNTTKAKAA